MIACHMKNVFFSILPILVCIISPAQQKQKSGSIWLTDPERGIYFSKQPKPLQFTQAATTEIPIITINEKEKYQLIDGFGFALTGGSAGHIIRMSPAARRALLRDLFAVSDHHIGSSYLRLSIGASDLSDRVFSYDDLPAGETDTAMLHFDLGPDKQDIIPVLKEILTINPHIKIMGSPWSPPVWMKTNRDTKGGSLQPAYYKAYAVYFVKYIQAMKSQGITIDAITVQNEPLHPGNNPSLKMLAEEQGYFVKSFLGPAFKLANIPTKIIIYDHNADKPEYPISILNDTAAAKYIDGAAFHLYGGKIEALSQVHEAHPDKNLYFTEQWVGAPGNFKQDIRNHVQQLIIGATRNWSKTVIEWNLAADTDSNPHTDRGGCTSCLGAVTITRDSVKHNPAYYIIAHAAKFVRPGSVRIASNNTGELLDVAFKTPDGKTVLIVLNSGMNEKKFAIRYRHFTATTSLAAGAVATYVW